MILSLIATRSALSTSALIHSYAVEAISGARCGRAKPITLACSPPPKGRVRWTLTLLETAVVELKIVDRASDNTICRTPARGPVPNVV